MVLKDDRHNVKAMYRRAQAEHGLKNFAECIRDCKSIVEVDSQNRDARALLKQAVAGQKEVDKQAKELYQSMCKALGKGPIPEPGKTKPVESDFEDDPEDVPMEEETKHTDAPEGEDARQEDAPMEEVKKKDEN